MQSLDGERTRLVNVQTRTGLIVNLFALSALAPIAAILFQSVDSSLGMGAMALVYIAALLALARNYERGVTQAVALGSQNRHLSSVLRTSESRFKDFAELSADVFWETDSEMRYTHVLGRCQALTGKPPETLLGRCWEEIQRTHIVQRAELDRHTEEVAARRAFTDYQFCYPRSEGELLVVLSSGKPVFDEGGAFRGYRGVERNFTEAHSLLQQLQYHATHDSLTDLKNRRAIEDRLTCLIEGAALDESEHALCYLDLDQFKVVNDTCGHSAGDELLRGLADLLKQHVASRDTLARLGGDEFVLLLEHCSIDQAHQVLSTLRKAIGEFRFEWDGQTFHVGVSIGLVPVTRNSGEIARVMSAADTACSAAKEAGRNRIHVYREDDAMLAERHSKMRWVSRMTRALEEDRFELYAQPIAAIAPRAPARESVQLYEARALGQSVQEFLPEGDHFELLLRMKDEDGRTIPPGAFLPSAEQYNFAPRLDRWVIHAGFEWLTANTGRLERLSLCAINLSGNSLGEEDFTGFVTEEFARADIPPSKICFEITETAAISNLAAATRFISTLKELGCRFALDDFGSGLSSFGYLKSLPVDFLKIDGLFVKGIADDPIDLAMVRSINEIGQVMGKKTIAEFVENDKVLTLLAEIGVDYAQGYGVGRPRPLEQMDPRRRLTRTLLKGGTGAEAPDALCTNVDAAVSPALGLASRRA